MGRERRRADQNDNERGAANRAAKQLDEPRLILIRAILGRLPLGRLGHRTANPQHQQRRQNADEENGPIRLAG